MDINDWLARATVVDRPAAKTKRQALAAIAETAARAWGYDPAPVLDALLEREAQGSTGVGQGVALPHAQLAGLDRMRAVFVRLDAPVAFDAVDDRPVDLLFALFAPVGDATRHLRALARVSRQLRAADLRERLRGARSADAIFALLAHDDTAHNAA